MADLFDEAPEAPEPRTLDELYRRMAALREPGEGVGRFVPGEGRVGAPLLFVGEQPGDQEDQQGRPFVGPAGQVFDRALLEAGIERDDSFVTNAVKRFHFARRGPRRIHEKPSTDEIHKERWWLEREIALVAPKVVVALGATALQALAGKAMPLGKNRGRTRWPDQRLGYVTVHPSYLLRLPDEAGRREAYAAFVEDLRQAVALVG
jgi:uracil-DNA glycosylase family protein